MCHLILILPLVGPVLFFFLPFERALIYYSLILLFSSLFYWLIWKDMHRPSTTGVEGMVGGTGQVIQNKKGKVKIFYKGEIWDAVCAEEVSLGEAVRVVGLERMRLIVQKGAGQQSQLPGACPAHSRS